MIKKLTHYKLTILLMLILIPSFIAVGLLNYYVQRDSIREELITTSLPLVRDLIDWEISTRLQDPLLASSLMARDTFLIDWIEDGEIDSRKIEKYLESIRIEHGFATSFFVSAKTLRYYSYQGVYKEISTENAHDIWYYDFINSQQGVALDVDTDEVSAGKLTIFINYRVESTTGELLGVVGVGVDMSDIAALLQKTQKTFGRVVYMVDESGLIQAHSDMNIIEKRNIHTTFGIDKIANAILDSKARTLDTQYAGTKGSILLTSRYIPDLKWYIIVEQDERVSLKLIRAMLLKTILIGFVASVLALLTSIRIVNKYNQKLEDSSRLDHLTQINNRMELDHRLLTEFSLCQRSGGTFSVLMIDLDNFKEINDTYGHIAGDDALVKFTQLVNSTLHITDSFGRWGGDEFLLILPKTKGLEGVAIANQLRSHVAGSDALMDFVLTISIGVAELKEDDSIESLLSRTDKALYRAKREGKDRAVLQG
ncbi:diguanylate cyclase (GGDEF) domain-containing protein [Sphaerochaeta pleomorpha str. Grapes]|uniref:diguanylate cyclase n=1 Tax=Sphaerochaeta pleomorpha (strain ATCC BAA-1885 / DSM 22778 / Grapes) TaxID=158190 RepID=G8QX07_SPHPG|nr:sensor domain-containing diguanylate cyclase [Sphaerochaeta pleomorpha]AEV29511.1 diguanylate cyclase (GGDEF) domain-containing protein [Sphaerochaeta pleomorpha str. Grapes]